MSDPLQTLLALPRFSDRGAAAYKPGIERMERLLDLLGRPERAFPAVLVAGTNGKGSTASMLAAVSTASGLRTGLHTSPHLLSVTERMRVDGVPCSESWLAGAVGRHDADFRASEASFFEATVALSFLYFAERAVDLAVVEVGLGGRLDATNVFTPIASLITNIGFDHTDILGDTIAKIAREKAGIIKPGVPVLTAARDADALRVIREEAERHSSPFHHVLAESETSAIEEAGRHLRFSLQTPTRNYEGLALGLAGRHQMHNAILAVRAAEVALPSIRHDYGSVFRGLAEVRQLSGLRGRLECLQEHPLVLVDVAHNPDGLSATLKAIPPERTLRVVFGAVRDKDVDGMAALLRRRKAFVFCVSTPGERGLRADDLCGRLLERGVTCECAASPCDGVRQALARSGSEDALLVTGSHTVAEGLLRAWPCP